MLFFQVERKEKCEVYSAGDTFYKILRKIHPNDLAEAFNREPRGVAMLISFIILFSDRYE